MDKEVIVTVKIYDDVIEFPLSISSNWNEDEVFQYAVDYVFSNIEVDVIT